ncbi:MAG: muramoyltetrapeptide carboxypeptidase [Bacteroidia bacterium]|jgi:muramoyltetrapeptide carboxypeptidase
MKKPPSLKKGSVVRIISTARKISPSEVEPSIKLLKTWGLTVELGRHIYATVHQFAGSETQRIQDLQEALNDETVDMIWCSRGGYGSTMLIDSLSFDRFIHAPKWVVGYSDITSLLCHITQNYNIATLHATMPINVHNQLDANGLQSVASLKSYLFNEPLHYDLPIHPMTKPGKAEGKIIGGNLSILYSMLGSRSSPKTVGKILFIEDLDEYLYHIDRMMLNLKRNNMLSGLSALLVGGLTDMNDNTVPFGKTAEEIVLDYVKDESYPVYFGFQAGHMSPNLALPCGMNAVISDNTLTIEK